MNAPLIAPSRRVRRTPFSDGVTRAGVKSYTVYNRMLLPAMFESLEADCAHLKEHVQVWDVACERQIAVYGPDAARLMQMLTPRDLSKMQAGQCYYVPIVDRNGGMLNDPVAVRHSDERWWISIADSDLLLWVKGVASQQSLNVGVFEPDVSPLAVQGPKSDDLMARIFGEAVRDVRFFRFGMFEFAGRSLAIARSGYSKQGGFEIYVDGSDLGMPLWDALFEAGADLQVRAGGPNLIERVESGLLSYGNDMTSENTPYECGLGKFCNLDAVSDCIGRDALLRAAREGPQRQIRALAIEGVLPPCDRAWPVMADGLAVGQVTSATYSPQFETNVAIAMIDCSHWDAGTQVQVHTPQGRAHDAQVQARFWR